MKTYTFEEIQNKYNSYINNIKFFRTRLEGCINKDTPFKYNNIPCWIWEDTLTKAGYGIYFSQYKIFTIHRLVYTIFKGLAPEGYDIDHLCNNRACCNPEHLEAVTHQENCRRMFERNPREKKEKLAKIKKEREIKTHCKHGHEFTEENTCFVEVFEKGKIRTKRRCKICSNDTTKRLYKKKKEEALAAGIEPITFKAWNKGKKFPKLEFKCGHAIIEGNIFFVNDKSRPEGTSRKCLICHDAKLKGPNQECRKGHEFTEENTSYSTNSKTGITRRVCKQCARDRNKAYYENKANAEG